MPIYEYQCDKCQQVIEAWQSLADEPLTTCQSCAGTLKKLISMSSFHLKGGGWYADGYSGAAQKACPGADAPKACPSADACPAKSSSETEGAAKSKPACGQGACCSP